MSLLEIMDPVDRWTAAGRRCGVATLVRVERSAPRPPGARFAVCENGETAGSISSGCVEGDLHTHILEVLDEGRARLVEYGITDEMAAGVGLACGGEIEVLIAPHVEDAAWRRLRDIVSGARAGVVVTSLSVPTRGRQLLLLPDGSRVGTLADEALDEQARRVAGPLLDSGGYRVLEVSEPPGRLFAEAFLPPQSLAIVGATPVAEALSHLASYLGFSVTVIDPREALARPEKFPDATVIHAWPEEGLELAGVGRYLDVAILAHDRKLDVPALDAALSAGCRYVGLLGGRRTQRLRREELREMGRSEEEVDRIRGPIGLDVGAVSPREIALSIVAELVSLRSPQHDRR